MDDSVAVVDDDWYASVAVIHDGHYFAAIIGVDDSGLVGESQSFHPD